MARFGKIALLLAALAVVATVRWGLLGQREARAAAATSFTFSNHTYPKVHVDGMSITEWPTGQLLVNLDDPPMGHEWDSLGDMLRVPDGVCWKLRMVSFHVSTGAMSASRNIKLVIRDLADTQGNTGRSFAVFALRFGANVYLDSSGWVGAGVRPNTQGAGSSQSAKLITHDNASLPDECIPPGYAWGTVTDHRQATDEFSEFWALVDPVKLS